jgi:D-alanyl-lipoteichoic acid acyltransferase DltB (MBOAT superfamily)
MLFSSYTFLLFLPLAIAALAVATQVGPRPLLVTLLALSLLFYGWFRVDYILILIVSAAVNFYLAALIERTARPSVFWFGVIFNVTLLAIFKYADFLVWNFDSIFRQQFALPNIVLPLALSFITFEQISFLSDVRSKKAHKGDFLRYLVFVTFFPKLIAGPIIRFREMAPQLAQAGVRSNEQVFTGLCIFCFALFKKVMIADNLSLVVDPTVVRLQDGLVRPLDAIAALLAYSGQIYFDFSAYSEMALGIAWMLGVQLPVNFNSPYKATSIIEFWRRWHITLSSFLRDYIYFPLGGGRLGTRRTAANLLIVMLIGGLWHGAAWTFVAWGFVHGVALVANHQVRQLTIVQRLGEHRAFRISAWALSMTIVLVAWALFRSPDFATAGRWLFSIVANAGNIPATTGPPDHWLVVVATLWALLLPNLPGIFRIAADRDAIDWTAPPGIPLPPVWVSSAAAIALLASLIGMARNQPNAFIYFQF